MRGVRALLRQRRGTTLMELLAASALMCVVLGMAAACIHPAAAAIRRTQRLYDAQLILDTVLAELRLELEGSYGYIRLCGEDEGGGVEFQNGRGETVQLSAQACEQRYGERFLESMHLEVEFFPPEDTAAGDKAAAVFVTAALYRDAARSELVDSQRLMVELRHTPLWQGPEKDSVW